MPKRNIVWLVVILLLGTMFYALPPMVAQQDSVQRVFGPLLEVRAQIHQKYVEEVDDSVLLEGAIRGMMAQLDPYSVYFTPEQYRLHQEHAEGNFEGIGVELAVQDGQFIVVSPIEDTPAFDGGIMAGDAIMTIDGVSLDGRSIEEISSLLRGPPGTAVTVGVKHEIGGDVQEIQLARSVISVRSVKGWTREAEGGWDYFVDHEHRIGYIRVSSFLENTLTYLDQALEQLLNQGMRGLVLDLRSNPGGLLPVAVGMADRFLDHGVVVSTVTRRQVVEVWEATPEHNIPPSVPIVALINEHSASAAEIVAGALRDHGRATLVGTRTFGKGSVQSPIPLSGQGGALKLTTAYYQCPSGRHVHKRPQSLKTDEWGVIPHFDIPLTEQETEAINQWRQKASVLRPPGLTSEPMRKSTDAPPPPPMADRQLQKALQVLVDTLGPDGGAPPS